MDGDGQVSELILWRHGQTDHNLGGRVQGRIDIALNERGRAQARRAAQGIASLGPVRIVCSPLKRAISTARELARLTGLEIQEDAALVERSFGAWEGLSREEIESGWPQQYRAWRRGDDPRGVDVETRSAAADRIGSALRGAAVPGETVVAVSHGAALSLGVADLLGLDPSTWFGLRGLDNCHWAQLRSSRRQPGWMLVGWNLATGECAGAP